MAMLVYQRVAYFQHRNWVRALRSSSAAGTDGFTLNQSAAGDSNRLRVGEHPMVNTRVYQATGFLSHEIHEIQCNQQLQRWDAKIYLVGGFKHVFFVFSDRTNHDPQTIQEEQQLVGGLEHLDYFPQ